MAVDILTHLKRKMGDDPAVEQVAAVFREAGIANSALFKRARRDEIKPLLSPFLLGYVTEMGMFTGEEEKQTILKAGHLMRDLGRLADVNFEKVEVFELPWPSLDAMPHRIVTATGGADGGAGFWYLGRPGFKELWDQFMSVRGCMEFDGVTGGGKSYLTVALAVKWYHDFKADSNKRLVCLFDVPSTEGQLVEAFRLALVLSFWDKAAVQRRALALETIEELRALFRDLKRKFAFTFIFDQWNKLDEQEDMKRLLQDIEGASRSLHGCSARQNAVDKVQADSRQHRGYFEAFSQEELDAYLQKEGVAVHPQLLSFTGGVPLYVRIFVNCQKAHPGDDERIKSKFLGAHEVKVLLSGLKRMVNAVRGDEDSRRMKLDAYSRLLVGDATMEDLPDLDPRWILVNQEGYLTLFSDFARSALVQRLDRLLPMRDMDVIAENVACSDSRRVWKAGARK